MSAAANEFGQIRDAHLARNGEPVAEIIPEGKAKLGAGPGQAEEGVTTVATGIAVGSAADFALDEYPSAEGRLAGRHGLGLIASIGASDGACTGIRDGAMARVEVITGPERRRRWTEEQKRAIVAASLKPGAVVSEVARRAEIGAAQIYRWRQALCAGREGFAQVVIAPAATAEAPPADDPGCCAVPAIEVEFAGEARVRIAASTPVALAAAVVKALSRR